MLERTLVRLARILSWVSGGLIAVIALTTLIDVVGRTFFHQSVPGALEINALLLVCLAFLGVAAAEWDGRHVEVTLLTRWVSGKPATLFGVVRIVIIVGITGAIVWTSGQAAINSYSNAEVTSGIIGVPMWPAKVVITIGMVLYLLSVIIKYTAGRLDQKPETADPKDPGV